MQIHYNLKLIYEKLNGVRRELVFLMQSSNLLFLTFNTNRLTESLNGVQATSELAISGVYYYYYFNLREYSPITEIDFAAVLKATPFRFSIVIILVTRAVVSENKRKGRA